MRDSFRTLCGCALLTLLGLAAHPTSLEAQQSVEAQRLVAAELAAFMALADPGGRDPVFPARAIRVQRVSGEFGSLAVWRATLPVSHAPPYLLLETDGRLLRLGGFSSPELSSVTLGSAATRSDLPSLRVQASILARLVDPNGAMQVCEPASPQVSDCPLAEWRARMPRDWPGDTTFVNDDDMLTVRMTVLSKNLHSYSLEWTPVAYAFVFSADGHVAAWSARRFEAFVAR